jgi:hypothetical protein
MTKTISDFNYQKALVVWEDINSCDDAWNSESDLADLKPAMCSTLGYVYEENANYIKMFATFSINPDGTMDVGDAIVIPKGVVMKIDKLGN